LPEDTSPGLTDAATPESALGEPELTSMRLISTNPALATLERIVISPQPLYIPSLATDLPHEDAAIEAAAVVTTNQEETVDTTDFAPATGTPAAQNSSISGEINVSVDEDGIRSQINIEVESPSGSISVNEEAINPGDGSGSVDVIAIAPGDGPPTISVDTSPEGNSDIPESSPEILLPDNSVPIYWDGQEYETSPPEDTVPNESDLETTESAVEESAIEDPGSSSQPSETDSLDLETTESEVEESAIDDLLKTGFIVGNTLHGSDGDDLLWGGLEQDHLVGGQGNDIFVLAPGEGSDIIHDFTSGVDRIGLVDGINIEELNITIVDGITQIRLGDEVLAELMGFTETLYSSDFVKVHLVPITAD
jgi:hypothetical protein